MASSSAKAPAPAPAPSLPVTASYPSTHMTMGAGVAIFHLATGRVVVCQHSKEKHWFLPKGRLNSGEDARHAAEREGFEESGYRNRVLPLPMRHWQTSPPGGREDYVAEAVWTQLMPLSRAQQYLLFWFVAETVPPGEERQPNASRDYHAPGRFPAGMTLEERVGLDVVTGKDGAKKIYEPFWHEGTGVDEDEALYRSYLLPIDEAMKRLKGSVMADVVLRGWEGIQSRLKTETEAKKP